MIYIIGINEDGVSGLSDKAKKVILEADTIFGGERHLNLMKPLIGETKEFAIIKRNIEHTIKEMKRASAAGKKVVVLASGDPLLFGISKKIIDELGKESVEIISNLSSVQLAFARIKETWSDAKIISLHKEAKGLVGFVDDIRESEKIVFLTSGKDDPIKIAKFLKENDIKVKRFIVLENLGGPRERVVELDPMKIDVHELGKVDFSPLNVVVVMKDREKRRFRTGIPEFEFKSFDGLITKAEVRAVVISKLSLDEESVIWDIGGGSGSISIECAMLARKGKVFCVEKNKRVLDVIKENLRRFSVSNVEVVFGKAPDVLRGLPDPQAVFIGGGGEEIQEIISECLRRRPANLVCTFVDITHLTRALDFIDKRSDLVEQQGNQEVLRMMLKNEEIYYRREVCFINVMKLKKIDTHQRLEHISSVFILHLSSFS